MRHIKNGGSLCYPTNHPSFITRAWPKVTSVSSSSATRSGGAAAKAAATWAALAGPARLASAPRTAHRGASFALLQKKAFAFLAKHLPVLGPVTALPGLQHEAAAAVEVDPFGGAMRQRHGLLEDIGVVGSVGHRRIRPRDIEDVAQLRKEELVVGALGRAGGFPARDEWLNG